MAENESIWKKIVKRYLINGLNGMALGLFCTLIVGLILKQIGSIIGNDIGTFLIQVGSLASICTGMAIGVGAAHSLNAPKLIVYASSVTGFIGANASALVNGTFLVDGKVTLSGGGDPLCAFIAALVGIEIGRLVAGKTKIDILITPFVTLIAGGVAAVVFGPPISAGMTWIGNVIDTATALQPFLMGIVISVLMGVALTLPISSAAIGIILGLSGIPAGAAAVGCSTQMIGFAVQSFRENKWDGLFAQGIGTSMIQMPNIVKNPKIWIPPTLASAILGPVATCVFKMKCLPSGSGMGTSGLVGQIMTWQAMAPESDPTVLLIKIVVLHFILPAVLTLIISEYMRKKGWIKYGDMKLDV